MIRRRLFLQLSEAQSTGLWRRPPPLETAPRWRCVLLINNLTAHYISQFCVTLLSWVLKIRIDFWTTGLTQWSTISENQIHQTSRSILRDGLIHPYTRNLCNNFLTIFWNFFGNRQLSGNFLFTGLFGVGQTDHT